MITSKKIAEIVNGKLLGKPDELIYAPFDLVPGKESCFSFLDKDKSPDLICLSKSNLVLVSSDFNPKDNLKTLVLVDNPRVSFFLLIEKYFYKKNKNANKGINRNSIISPKAIIGENVDIGPNVIVEDYVEICPGASIASNSFIGKSSYIGENSIIHPNCTIYDNCKVSKNVEINSGCIVGAHGLGVMNIDGELQQVPHIGIVEIEDNVVLGAGCTIDRATISKTKIGQGTKIDGQVHIAHNVQIGRNCIIAGQSAIGGSTTIGNNVILGGQTGIIDNLSIGNNCKVAAKSAVMKSLEDNSVVSGIPAIDHRLKRRLDVLFSKLPDLFKKVQKI